MIFSRTAAISIALALSACGSADPPEAPPGAVEQVTEELARNEAAERIETIRRIDREAEARAAASKRRIRAIEEGQPEAK